MSNDLYNSEAENFLLAAVVRYPEDYITIVGNTGLSSADFVGVEAKHIAAAIDAAIAERKPPTLPYIIDALKNAGHADSTDYLSRLSSIPCGVDEAKGYARAVRNLSVKRRVANVGAKIIEYSRELPNAEDVIEKAEGALRVVTNMIPGAERSPDPKDILARIRSGNIVETMPIFFAPTLQAYTGGLRTGEFWVIGAGTSVGKSQFTANMVLDLIHDREKRVALFNIEMSQEVYMMRMLSIKSGVPFKSIRDQVTIGHDQDKALAAAEAYLGNSGLRLYDTTGTITSIKQESRKIKHREGLDVVVVDYIQSIRGSKGDEVADAREVAIELQALAKELRVCVVGVSQISNQQAKDDIAAGGQGDFYNFKGHGAIKDNADVGIMLRRNRRSKSPLTDVQLAKNRNGDLTEFTLVMDLATGRMVEREDEDDYEDMIVN